MSFNTLRNAMQDLKHLSIKKRSLFSRLFSIRTTNRRLSTHPGRRAATRPSRGKRREQLRHLLLFLAIVLALTPVCVFVYQASPRALQALILRLRAVTATSRVAEAARQPQPVSRFEAAHALLPKAVENGGCLSARSADGETFLYTLKGDLQQRIHEFMVEKQVPYGVLVAIEPASGRILAMTAYSSVDPGWARSAPFDLYPMASLFKIITAAAALENGKITPETVVEFRGNFYSENPQYWEIGPKGRNNRMDVTGAMGKSINPLYGRVACDIAGKSSVMEYVGRFGFNQALLPGVPAKKSLAVEPRNDRELMRMGAGLDHEVKVSPLHAATIMAAIANGGRMMSPVLTEKVLDASGMEKELQAPRELRRLVSAETAASLTRMLSKTVISGTSRRAFHDRQGRPILGDIEIAAKTGSINGTAPKGHYSWFAAFAPAHAPRIALVALVINQDRWKIKASQLGGRALTEFFDK